MAGGSPSEGVPVGGERASGDVGSGVGGLAEIEPEPAASSDLFGPNLVGARRYVALLADAGTVRGLIGPREAGRLWTRHVLNCALAAAAIPPDSRVVDIGSGAGLPGIPLLLARPDIRVDLVETLQRRVDFLEEAIDELGLEDRCRVLRARAEDAVGSVGGADVVTARAVAPLATLARWGAPLLRTDGLFVALKGRSAFEEIARDQAAAARCGVVDLRVREIARDDLAEGVTLVVGRRADSVAGRGGKGPSRRRPGRERAR